ncbi:hypothetical protein K466DRAFT_569698 [Polyporus arcularius HHB13444]|uniref:CxC2-like cysteine cluster KDZ transposase-associated domain-containing protein n=1 Tax=Polyporus arcularius HHB13444 TaxID=1314778 RepID=A0A5C3P3P2_9APHY|nr:hypothetical protein K466DRAFT_569698 [Polyporus arcularius HHB13444]
MPKRCKDSRHADRYTFDSDDEKDTSDPSSIATERHRHVDFGTTGRRPSKLTSFVNVPRVPSSKRPRASSAPPAPRLQPEDQLFDNYMDGVDHSYALDEDPDRPLLTWIKRIPQYLGELLRLEGRGDHASAQCARCGTLGSARYRCNDCSTVALHCRDCIKDVHLALPLHRIREWKDGFFQKATLKHLGLRVQLGHAPGDRCFNPKRAFADDFVVLDTTGIHEVGVDFCGCDKNQAIDHATQLLRARWYPATSVEPKTAATFGLLEHFHVLSLQSKISGWEYYTTLSRRTDNTGSTPVKDRYPAFMTMNLPEGWENAPAWKRGVPSPTTPTIRLSTMGVRTSSRPTGNLPPEKHTHCNNHNAVKLANLKNGVHLAATGVGAVDCARHGFRCPCAVGDLQKGERYANMDYLLHFTLLMTMIPWITATYDIACQFGINLFYRFREIKLAVPQRNAHVLAYHKYNDALPKEDTDMWTGLVTAWEGDPSKPNPFMITRPSITESSIRKKLLEEDAEALRLGKVIVLHEDFSSSTMISAGIDLEEQQ